MAVKPIPEGYSAVTPYLIVDGAADALAFYKKVFDAVETLRMPAPGGKVGHAEFHIGGATMMLADECPEREIHGPKSAGAAPIGLLVYVADVDAIVARATEAGARLKQPVENKFYGDRMGTIVDPFGHVWYVATHVEDVSAEEMQRRASGS